MRHGIDFRQMPRDTGPGISRIRAAPDLARCRAEVHPQSLTRVRAHRLTQHCQPGLRARQPTILALPALSSIAGDVYRGLAIDGSARPYGLAVHRKYPGG